MFQIQTFSDTTAGRTPAPQTRRTADVFPSKALSGVSLRIGLARLRAWRLRQAERAALQSLMCASDHLLDDIGLCRHDVQGLIERL